MADTVVSATNSVVFHINDNDAVWDASLFAIWKRTSADLLFRVLEDGVVYPGGELQRAAAVVFVQSDTSSADIALFRRGSATKLALQYASSQAVFEVTGASDGNIQLEGSTIVLRPDRDSDSSPNYVRIRNGGGSDRWVWGDDTSMTWYDTSNLQHADFSIAGGNATLGIGRNLGAQGVTWLRAQTAGSARAAIIEMQRENGSRCFLWVDSSGVLRISTADPGDVDTGGSSVGSQS